MTNPDEELPRRTRRLAVGVGSMLLVAAGGVLALAATVGSGLGSGDVVTLDGDAIAQTSQPAETSAPTTASPAATLAYARCMRDHGVDYGSPTAATTGRTSTGTATTRQREAAFRTADVACRELLVS
jgi:hypothetical protein